MKKLIRSEVFWILLLAAILRIAFLAIKPPHFDEGVNGWFVDQMVKNGYFKYDPSNYHGPLYFYILFVFQQLFGRNLWALRMPAVISSLLCVFWMFRFRDFFGKRCVTWAAVAMAVSPGYVFYGRYSIHESLLVFFTMLFVWGGLGAIQTGLRKYSLGILIGVTGMILVKETWVIHAGSFLLALGCLYYWQFVRPSASQLIFAKQQWKRQEIILPVIAAMVAILFFYSGNFLHIETLGGLGEAYLIWFKTGAGAGGHIKGDYGLGHVIQQWLAHGKEGYLISDTSWCTLLNSLNYLLYLGRIYFLNGLNAVFGESWIHCLNFLNYYWLFLITRYEWPALAGIFASLWFFWRRSAATIRLAGIYGCGVLAAYSLIPYKTPWCIISLLWPFYLVLFYFIENLKKWKREVSIVAALMLAASLGWSIRLNFFNYVNIEEPYVYVQTLPEYSILVDPLLHLAKQDPQYYYVSGQILLDSYYPLPWVLGDFPQVGYYKQAPVRLDADFVVVESKKAGEIEKKLEDSYYRREFQLRDAQEKSTVYFRASKFAKEFNFAQPEVTPVPKK